MYDGYTSGLGTIQNIIFHISKLKMASVFRNTRELIREQKTIVTKADLFRKTLINLFEKSELT